jgi:hypothetical protein
MKSSVFRMEVVKHFMSSFYTKFIFSKLDLSLCASVTKRIKFNALLNKEYHLRN